MNPYYQEDGITIYNADCREILETLPHAAAVVTDPPYNVGKDYGTHNDSMSAADYSDWVETVTAKCVEAADKQFWVAPRYKLELWLHYLPGAHLIVIPRGATGPFRQGWSDQFEIALAVGKPAQCVPDLWSGIRLKGEGYFFREETYGHPGYTPYSIMRRAVELLSEPGELIVEPFCGTGTTLRAAKDTGRQAVGIEVEERYCEIAANRMRQQVLKLA